jgi:hypothetical protein
MPCNPRYAGQPRTELEAFPVGALLRLLRLASAVAALEFRDSIGRRSGRQKDCRPIAKSPASPARLVVVKAADLLGYDLQVWARYRGRRTPHSGKALAAVGCHLFRHSRARFSLAVCGRHMRGHFTTSGIGAPQTMTGRRRSPTMATKRVALSPLPTA